MVVLDSVVGNDPCENKHGKDPQSQAAWQRAKLTACESRQIILDALASVKGVGATCKELSNYLNKPMHKISGRITELIEIGAVRKTDIIRDGGRVVELV